MHHFQNYNKFIEILCNKLNMNIEQLYDLLCNDNMTLTEFLSYFDFDYCIYEDGEEKKIGLIDNQGANLGGIEEERYNASEEGVIGIIDRLDIYYKDYIFDGLEDVLEYEHNIDISNMSWEDLYNKVKELNLGYDMDIMPYIFGDKKLELDFDKKEIKKESDNDETN